jgi:hypothetical protein
MGSYRTPIKHDWRLRNTVYIFLGDANLAMRLELSVTQKPFWYDKNVHLACHLYDIQYASWDGKLNLIHTPGSKRTHPLIAISLEGDAYSNEQHRSIILDINAIDDFPTPEIPEFSHMSPLDVIRTSRCPVPSRLDINWKLINHDTSTLKMSAVSQETGIPVDIGARKRMESDPSYLDDIFQTWGLANIT